MEFLNLKLTVMPTEYMNNKRQPKEWDIIYEILTHSGIMAGKLNGVTPAHTPNGSR